MVELGGRRPTPCILRPCSSWHGACVSKDYGQQRSVAGWPPPLAVRSVGDRDRIDAIAVAILEHLRRFPDARDTARGVRDWWLGPELNDASLAEVELALQRLVDGGRAMALPTPDGGTLFAKPPDGRPRARRRP